MILLRPNRRIASHRLLCYGRWFVRAWVEVDDLGRVLKRGSWGGRDECDTCDSRGDTCEALDRMPYTEFYSGILLCGHYKIRMEAFMKEGLTLMERLATLRCTKEDGLTLLEGIDLRTEEPLHPRLRQII